MGLSFHLLFVSFLLGSGVYQDPKEPNHHLQANKHVSHHRPLAHPRLAWYCEQISDHVYCQLAPLRDVSRILVRTMIVEVVDKVVDKLPTMTLVRHTFWTILQLTQKLKHFEQIIKAVSWHPSIPKWYCWQVFVLLGIGPEFRPRTKLIMCNQDKYVEKRTRLRVTFDTCK